jgi:glycosyltransferase involved in cell wall biosynthesis
MTRRVCLIYPHLSTFVEADRGILAEAFDVTTIEYHGKRDLVRLAMAVRRSDLSVSWFALGHAAAAVMFSRWFRKGSVVVVGGWDVAAMPEIPYGAMRSARQRRRTTRTLNRATLVLAVSEASRKEALRWTERDIFVAPLGVDTDFFSPIARARAGVITVASFLHDQSVRTKGVDVLLETARMLPDVPFVIVGRMSPGCSVRLRSTAPPNVRFTDWLDPGQLREEYRAAKVYAQLSAHESFGLALAEAMACGCVPVVSDRGSLPEVVGHAGLVAPYGDTAAAAHAIRDALRSGEAGLARELVLRNYSLSLRRRRLLGFLEAIA